MGENTIDELKKNGLVKGMTEEEKKALQNFALKQIINNLTKGINELPGFMEKGLKLVYPQMQEKFLKDLLDGINECSGMYIENALQVMEALDNGATIQEASELLIDYGNFSKQITTGFVLAWSKRGPEFFKKTLRCPLNKLPKLTLSRLRTIEENNAEFEKDKDAVAPDIENLKASINKLPEWMERGLKLVDPEKQEPFLTDLLKEVSDGCGFEVNKALEIMEVLDKGATTDEAYALFDDYDSISSELISSYVTVWSKRGIEFFDNGKTHSI